MRTRKSGPGTHTRFVSPWTKSAGGWAALCLAFTILVPADVTAQVGTCWVCVPSDFHPTSPFSTMCQGQLLGRTYCASKGTQAFHLCIPYGPVCWSGMSGAADELAVASAKAGLTPAIDSDYLVVAEANEIVVMRRCGAEVARFAVSDRGVDGRAGLAAMDPPDALGRAAAPGMTAAKPRARVSQQ